MTEELRTTFLLPALVFLVALPLSARAQTSTPPGSEILAKVEQLYAGIDDYTVTLDIVAHMERMNIPPMHVTMYFKKPDKVHFASEGFAILPREGFRVFTGELSSRYTVDRVENAVMDSSRKYLLTLVPKDEAMRSSGFLLYVDPGRWTPDKITSRLPDGRTMIATLQHQEVDGRWLPSEMSVLFSSPVKDTVEAPAWEQQAAPAMRRFASRTGSVSVRFSDYRINTGLSDDLFKQEPK